MTYKIGNFIGSKYEVIDIFENGGFGLVYLVFSHETQYVYALKTFRDEYFTSEKVRERFRREAQAMTDMEPHPFIVRQYCVEEIDGRLYIVMEYIGEAEGMPNSLEGFLASGKPADLMQSLRWLIQFCHGMEHAYLNGIQCHRDIKPPNILLGQDSTVKISDFGLIRQSATETAGTRQEISVREVFQTKTGLCLGTLQYMPPEQFTNFSDCDERSDIYSLGIVMYQLVTGSDPPFIGKSESEYFDLHSKNSVPNLESELWPIIKKCLEKNSADRYQNFKDLRIDLEKMLLRLFDQTVEIPPKMEFESADWSNKAISLSSLGYHDEAVQVCYKALELDPQNSAALCNLGNSLHQLGRTEEALVHLVAAVNLNSRSVPALYNLGDCLKDLHRYKEALEKLFQVLSIDPNHEAAIIVAGICAAEAISDEEGLPYFERAIRLNPDSYEAWSNKAVAMDTLGRKKEAAVAFRKLFQLNSSKPPENPTYDLDYARRRLKELEGEGF